MTLSYKTALQVVTCLCVCGLAACNDPGKTPTVKNPVHTIAESAESSEGLSFSSDSVDAQPLSSRNTQITGCAADIGAPAADKRVKICLAVSPATHPPCNTANSCAMIEDEIARSCALFDGKGSPMSQCQPSPTSQKAAVAVISRYYSALNAHDYATAWQQWGDNGPPNQTLAEFTSGFAHTVSTQVTIGKLEPSEGGAGSIYQTVPVIVDAQLDNGKHQRFTGEYVVRRVNNVDGATPFQRRWHMGSAHLKAAAN